MGVKLAALRQIKGDPLRAQQQPMAQREAQRSACGLAAGGEGERVACGLELPPKGGFIH